MKYFQVLCLFFAFTVIKSQQVDVGHYSSSSKNIRSVSDRDITSNGQISSSSNQNNRMNINAANDDKRAMQQVDLGVGSIEYDIKVIDYKSKQVSKFIIKTSNMNTTLGEVREKLKSQGFGVEDRFLANVNGELVRILNETNITLNDVKNANAVYVDFDSDSIKQYLKGLKKDADGQLVMTNHPVADFKRYPQIRTKKFSYLELSHTFDPKKMDLLKFGITDKSANYAEILSYSAAQQNTDISGQGTNHFPLTSYNIARYVLEKKEIEITQDDLIINSEFYDELRRALSTGGLHLSTARKLLAVLQKYGWYVPLHYKTGGSFYIAGNKTINNSAGNSRNMAASSAPNSFIIHSSLVDMYVNAMQDKKQWKIVEYKRLLPILLLLEDYDNWTLSQCIKLLTEFRMDLQNEETDINVREYSLRLEQIIHNKQ